MIKSSIESDCPVCYQLMVEPVKLPCSHYLCYMCVEKCLNNKSQCPYCRESVSEKFKAQIDKALQNEIQKNDSENFKLQKEVLILKKQLSADLLKIFFKYGNTYTKLPEQNTKNIHKWTVFLKMNDSNDNIKKYVKKVTFGLDDSFGMVSKSVNFPPFQYTCVGWGTFVVPITIKWQYWLQMPETTIHHLLVFEGKGFNRKIAMSFSKTDLKKCKIPEYKETGSKWAF